MDSNTPDSDAATDRSWTERERYWQRKLGRIRLGVEPVDEQLAKYHRVTWMLTAVPLGLGLMFVGLFSAFRRPDLGIVIALILFAPVISVAWIDFALLRSRVQRYRRELEEFRAKNTASGRT